MRRRWVWIGRLALLLVAAGLTLTTTSSAQGTIARGPSARDSNAVIRAGDVIRLKIWREPDLSGDFQVNESGVVVVPRLGPIDITAVPPEMLRARLVDGYRAMLSHGAIEVTFLRRVQVLGAVRNPGLYPLDPTITVSDALAVAGGTTPDGDPERLELRRGGAMVAQRLDLRARIADSPVRSGDQLFVPERRWSSRNAGILASAIAAGVSLAIALFRR